MKSLTRTVVCLAAPTLLACQALATGTGYSLGLNFGADEPNAAGTGRVPVSSVAGVDAVKQANWNNLEQLSGNATALVADNAGTPATTSAAVDWSCANTWASTGRGEENNGFTPGTPDHALMIGYLDTGDPTTTTVNISGLPSQLTSGYDVYVYLLGGSGGNRGGGYRILDASGNVLRDYLVGDGAVNPSTWVRDLGLNHADKGNYVVFRGLTASSIIVEATTEAPNGMVRAPINAIQLVAATRDTTAPSVPANLSSALVGANLVNLKWDAATDNSGAVHHYEIDRGGTIIGKTSGTTFEDRSVSPSTGYSYKVKAVDDSLNASALSGALAVTTVGEVEKTGQVKFEAWTGMDAGTAVSLLTDWIDAGNKPTLVSYTTSLDSRPVYPDDTHEQYGAILSGWLTPKVGGAYTFFLRSDDASELWLSTTDKAADLVKIAEQTGCCNAFTEPDTANPGTPAYTSLPVTLAANTKYWIQLIYKEGGGGDYGQVAWRLAGDTTAASALAPITGSYLSSLVDATGASINITQQPQAVSVPEGTTTTFSVASTFTSPYALAASYQWYRNDQVIQGAIEATYTTPELSITGDNGAKFKCVASVPGASVTSTEAVLTVVKDTVAPKITKVKASSVSTLIVSFDEPVDAATAGTVGNYSLSDGVTVSQATASESSVLLNTGSLVVGKSYTLTAGGVKDRYGNALLAGTTISFTVNVVTYADVILADGPVMFYRFEESTGQTTKNLGTAGTAADGLWMAGSGPDDSSPADVSSGTGPRPGEFLGFAPDNKSGLFTGQEGLLWIDAQQQLLNNLGSFSLEYWVKPSNRVSDPTAFGTRIGIVGQNDAIEYGFISQSTIQIWTPGGGSLDTAYSFPDNTWHHVATIADGKSIKNYFDGKFINQTTATASNYGSSTYNVHVGGGGAFDATGNHFTGEIDEVAIFQKAISADRIAAHFKAGKEGGEVPGTDPVIQGITRQGSNAVIRYDGVLQSAAAVTGPWTDVAGAPTGAGQTFTTPATAPASYYRSMKQ
ncbi:MAG: Ig-like domain-containing protein [Verrucomicrobiales bacterium]|nr:Ig-like domain-containing protein [Verrucomicrobiales bacterium]